MNKVNEKPILFSTAMVKAILAGRKAMTRRVIKPQPIDIGLAYCWKDCAVHLGGDKLNQEQGNREMSYYCPYGKVGDHLWVRETYTIGDYNYKKSAEIIYKAGGKVNFNGWDEWLDKNTEHAGRCGVVDRWKPSIFMLRKFSRITLKITDIRVERVQDISSEDAVKEGAEYMEYGEPGIAPLTVAQIVFASYWDKINAKRGYSFEINPYVWVISFKVLV